MNDKMSALLDQELGSAERARLWDRMAEDPAGRALWERYHTIRALVRHEIDWTLSAGFAERVASRIAQEDRPAARPLSWMRGQRGLLSRLAIAGSVAAMALLGLRFSLRPETLGGGSPELSAVVASTPGPVENASLKGSVPWSQLSPRAQRRLNGLLLEHSEFTPQGADGLIGYGRIVGYDRARQAPPKQ